jgi:hypothetical protein
MKRLGISVASTLLGDRTMNTRTKGIATMIMAAALALAGPGTSAAAVSNRAAEGRWVGEWTATVRFAANGELAGEPITSSSETSVAGRLAAHVAAGGTVFEAPAASWSYRGLVSHLSAETTGAGELRGGRLVLADGTRLARGSKVYWRDERRVGSMRTVLKAADGEQVMEGPVDNGLEPIVFTVTEVTPTAIVGTIDAGPLAKYESTLSGPARVDVSGGFELRLAGSE